MKSDVKSDLDEAAEFERRVLKAFLHPSPPLERKSILKVVTYDTNTANFVNTKNRIVKIISCVITV